MAFWFHITLTASIMQQINAFFTTLHQYIGGNNWFIFLLLGTGFFFTLYLKFPQIRYFRHAIRIIKGKYDKKSEGMVAILEPFIDTIIICFLTGMVLLSSGVWNQKVPNQFQRTDMVVLAESYDEHDAADIAALRDYLNNKETLPLFTGTLTVVEGKIQNDNSILHARSVAEGISVSKGEAPFTGEIHVASGRVQTSGDLVFIGSSLIHSAPLTTLAYTQSFLGDSGKYIVALGLLLFAFSTAIAWSYYGDRAITYLVGTKYVMLYRIIFVTAFFVASFVDTTIIWNLSMLTVAFMTVPNLIGLLILHREVKQTIGDYWIGFKKEYTNEEI